MINVSDEFKETMHERTDFRTRAIIKLLDGTQLDTLESEDFALSNNSFTDAADVGTFPLGIAISRSIQIEFMNDDDKFSGYDFYGAEITLYLTFRLSTTTERISIGTFTVVSPATIGDTIIATATDDMHKADIPYNASLTFPATAMELLSDVCTQCGLTPPASFANSDYTINSVPAGYTCRQIIAAVAMIACGNARISRSGELEILSYDFSNSLDSNKTRLKNWKNLKVDTDDIVITGVKTTYTRTITGEDGEEVEEETTLLKGAEGYVISIENPLISGNEETAMDLISAPLIGAAFRKFEGDHIAYPLAEFMDQVEVQDRKGNVYSSFVTDINFTFFSFTTLKNSAESAVRQQSTYSSDAKSAVEKAEQLVKNEQTARDKAVAALSKALSESSGMYSSEEEQEDGSAIRYLHDKPTLAESENVIKVTADAIGFSTDGGETYPFGVQINGDVITRILTAIGIEADWINGGTITGVALKGENIDIRAESSGTTEGGVGYSTSNALRTFDTSVENSDGEWIPARGVELSAGMASDTSAAEGEAVEAAVRVLPDHIELDGFTRAGDIVADDVQAGTLDFSGDAAIGGTLRGKGTAAPVCIPAMTARAEADQTLTTTSATTIGMTYVRWATPGSSSYLELSDGGIKCLVDGYVEVSGKVFFASGFAAGDHMRGAIFNGTNNISVTSIHAATTASYYTAVIPPIVMAVSAGDIIYLCAYGKNGYVIGYSAGTHASALTVKYIG